MNFSKRITNTADPIVHVMKEIMYERLAAGNKVVDFGQAVVDFPPPKNAQDAIRKLDSVSGLHKLCNVPGLPKLRAEIAEYRQEGFDKTITKSNILVTAGANHAFLQTMLGITDPEDEVMLLSPHFFNHEMCIQLVGCKPIFCKLDESNNFQPTIEQIEHFWSDNIKALIVVTPGNPHGTIIDEKLLLAIQGFVASKNSWLIVDESYVYFDYRDNPPKEASLSLDKTIRIGSFSKSFSLAGWRIGYLIGNEPLIHQLIKSQDATIIHPSVASQQVALAALQEKNSHLQNILPQLDQRRILLKEKLMKIPAFASTYGDGGVFVFAKLRDIRDDRKLAIELAEKVGVITSPGSAWGAPGYLRFSYGLSSTDEIIKGCNMLGEYFTEANAGK